MKKMRKYVTIISICLLMISNTISVHAFSTTTYNMMRNAYGSRFYENYGSHNEKRDVQGKCAACKNITHWGHKYCTEHKCVVYDCENKQSKTSGYCTDHEKEFEKIIADHKKKTTYARTNSSKKYSDPYDVNEYDDPDDFAEEWAEEFDDDYDDGYDEAYDYWCEHYTTKKNKK